MKYFLINDAIHEAARARVFKKVMMVRKKSLEYIKVGFVNNGMSTFLGTGKKKIKLVFVGVYKCDKFFPPPKN